MADAPRMNEREDIVKTSKAPPKKDEFVRKIFFLTAGKHNFKIITRTCELKII